MYNHNLIEKKWQKKWMDDHVYDFKDDLTQPKAYILDMFPYPSGQGLHVGHPRGYTATDIFARYKKLTGYNILHPIGWDAFGLPAEQYAISTNNHPKEFTNKNINHFRVQLQKLGFCYHPNKEVNTTDPNYYRWTQWIFTKLFEHDLAEIRDVDVNWCEQLGTVLANEEVLNVDGRMVSERGCFPVVKKPMRQWILKITKYADKLLDGLNEINWPEHLKAIQRKWIGRSAGAIIKFKISEEITLEAFTTRADTIYGVSFIAIAPEHPLAKKLIKSKYKNTCEQYIADTKTKSELERKVNSKEQTGVFTGTYALNPINNKQVPIYICDYVLMNYATGILMGVPAHDERDFNFAKKYNLPINFVIEANDYEHPYLDDGIHINSNLINGLNNLDAQNKIIEYLEANKLGQKEVFYKLKDWLFSRQRYWGEPFPIVFDENNNPHLVKDLPLILPECINFKPSSDGKSPLASLDDWVNITIGNKKYYRETNTMPQWAGSSWYYLGYLLKQNDGSYLPLNSEKAKKIFKRWLPVDTYVGGQEHAVLHLLYARFWHRFLYDIGIVPTKEPFNEVINQGMILGPNGEKMSKSRGNVINPDEIIISHGADALRVYEMFMGPINTTLPWNDEGINGVRKWLDRVYRYYESRLNTISENSCDKELEYQYHLFIKNVTENIDKMNFNVAISDMMVFVNAMYASKEANFTYMHNFLIILSCFAPHLADELHEMIGHKGFCLFNAKWPSYDPKKLVLSKINLPVMINGKHRDTILINNNASQEQALKIALNSEKIKAQVGNNKIKKIIFVENKILNILI
ncbi:leucyl-tRNA synthetase [Candidatus Malacoplasma girerdii]|uniref:Leucine--tRNA ligase n=1 Tax=Candidatus Malacoplasma girerdii TaxID=1318617 RepID=A0A097SSI6_9BACT|nr:leucyl-tRNA synthetase [Candidatus Malacoplasma girerdii]